ncbi:hypothetical protein Tco_0580417 [Tanacetum coccineum]
MVGKLHNAMGTYVARKFRYFRDYESCPKKKYYKEKIIQMNYDSEDDNSQVKNNKIDLLVQQYEQFTIIEEESVDSGFARFNSIITSLKALDEGFSSKNYVRKFLRALHPKWRAKVMAIEESKDLSSLALDGLIGNLIVHEVVMEKDFVIYKGKKERVKSIALTSKKESSDDETLTSGSDDKEYAMADQQVVSELVKKLWIKKKLLLYTRYVCYKEMDQDSAHMVAASKVPMLKPGVETIIVPITAEEKAKRGLELKVLDQTFDRIQKLISQLEIHGESISQEDVNKKFLRSLSPKWNTHTIMWRNKPEIDTLSIYYLLIQQPEEPMNQSQGTSSLKHKHNKTRDGFNKVQMICLTMRAKGDSEETLKEFSVNGTETIGFDNSNVELEITTFDALVSCDSSGYDWSDQAEEGPTNFAHMAYSSTSSNSEVSTDSNCSSSCLENVKILKEQNEQLLKDLRTSKFKWLISYKMV